MLFGLCLFGVFPLYRCFLGGSTIACLSYDLVASVFGRRCSGTCSRQRQGSHLVADPEDGHDHIRHASLRCVLVVVSFSKWYNRRVRTPVRQRATSRCRFLFNKLGRVKTVTKNRPKLGVSVLYRSLIVSNIASTHSRRTR